MANLIVTWCAQLCSYLCVKNGKVGNKKFEVRVAKF